MTDNLPNPPPPPLHEPPRNPLLIDNWPNSTPPPPPKQHKQPRKWEPWAIGLLFLLYLYGISNPDPAIAKAIAKDPVVNLFLFVAVGWLIAVLVRGRNYRRQVGNP